MRKLSKSGTIKLPRTRGFAAVGDIADLFPAAGELVADVRDDHVVVVNHFFAHEVKRDAGTVKLIGDCEAEASFSFWYDWDDLVPRSKTEVAYEEEQE